MKNILIDKKFGHSSVARSIHKCFQIIFTACVCVRAHEGESHSCVPVLMKKYVCVGCLQEKKKYGCAA